MGVIMDNQPGKLDALGKKLYEAADYRAAIYVIPIFLFIGGLLFLIFSKYLQPRGSGIQQEES